MKPIVFVRRYVRRLAQRRAVRHLRRCVKIGRDFAHQPNRSVLLDAFGSRNDRSFEAVLLGVKAADKKR